MVGVCAIRESGNLAGRNIASGPGRIGMAATYWH